MVLEMQGTYGGDVKGRAEEGTRVGEESCLTEMPV